MTSSGIIFIAAMLAVLATLQLLRRGLARRGSGRLAQLRFKQQHGASVTALLDGAPEPDRSSPWIAITIAGRRARLVAASISRTELQAGIELLEWRIPIQVWHTDGDPSELELPDGIEFEQVREIVERLAAAHVDNVASQRLGEDAPHVLRIRFEHVEQLPQRLELVAPLLDQLEQLGRQSQPPNDCVQ